MRKIVAQDCRITENKALDRARLYFSLKVTDFSAVRKIYPGQFVHVRVARGNDPFFRRAFSIAAYNQTSQTLQIIYKVVGKGTAIMSRLTKGDHINLIGPLGNSFASPKKSILAVMVAGGVGLPPLCFLAEQAVATGYDPGKIFFFYGGQTKKDLIELARLRRMGIKLFPCTDDGSYGFHGFVTQALSEKMVDLDCRRTTIYGCGPEPMLAALQELSVRQNFNGQVSLEAPMPCGVGVCLGCIKPLADEPEKYVRVCHDGPVFEIGEVSL
ncbi:MAG: dihydroorotate dehydrogenase electron transfer subunit [FCB group bacterium]|nr:dihydroorotate dehydrogenase electron transfer subunit [FCB group bacterium]